jgi:hypothetical protein
LVDHLRLTDDDRRVHVFHHASFLYVQQQRFTILHDHSMCESANLSCQRRLPTTQRSRGRDVADISTPLPILRRGDKEVVLQAVRRGP